MSEARSHEPFSEHPVVEISGGHSTIARLESRPELMVRESPATAPDGTPLTTEQMAGEAALGKKLFDDLAQNYGFNIPHFQYVVGAHEGDGKKSLFTVVDRVFGESLDRSIQPESTERPTDQELSDHYAKLVRYHRDVWEQGGMFLADITRNNTQCMYGTTANDPEPKIYVTDVDPIVRSLNVGNLDSDRNAAYFRSLSDLSQMVYNVDPRISAAATASLDELVSEIPANKYSGQYNRRRKAA